MPRVNRLVLSGAVLIGLCLSTGLCVAQDDPREFGGPLPVMSTMMPLLQLTDLRVRDDLMSNRYMALFDLRAEGRIPRFVESDALLLTIRVLNQEGTVVRTVVDEVPAERFHYQVVDHGYSLQWDATDADGRQVPAGLYRFEITVVMPSWEPASALSAWFDVR